MPPGWILGIFNDKKAKILVKYRDKNAQSAEYGKFFYKGLLGSHLH